MSTQLAVDLALKSVEDIREVLTRNMSLVVQGGGDALDATTVGVIAVELLHRSMKDSMKPEQIGAVGRIFDEAKTRHEAGERNRKTIIEEARLKAEQHMKEFVADLLGLEAAHIEIIEEEETGLH
jgi:hypothetical protein